jgi:hypothetical protein
MSSYKEQLARVLAASKASFVKDEKYRLDNDERLRRALEASLEEPQPQPEDDDLRRALEASLEEPHLPEKITTREKEDGTIDCGGAQNLCLFLCTLYGLFGKPKEFSTEALFGVDFWPIICSHGGPINHPRAPAEREALNELSAKFGIVYVVHVKGTNNVEVFGDVRRSVHIFHLTLDPHGVGHYTFGPKPEGISLL